MSLLPFTTVFFEDWDPLGQDWLTSDPFRDSFYSGRKSSTGRDLSKPFSPLLTTDIFEVGNEYKLCADLPGVDPNELEVTVNDKHMICIKAERKHCHDTGNDRVIRLERSYGNVERKIRMPMNADLQNAKINFKNGVLGICIPKLEDVGPQCKKLTIESA